jgi:hypothetical protein
MFASFILYASYKIKGYTISNLADGIGLPSLAADN